MTRLEIAARLVESICRRLGVVTDAHLDIALERADALIARELATRPKAPVCEHKHVERCLVDPSGGGTFEYGDFCVDCGWRLYL